MIAEPLPRAEHAESGLITYTVVGHWLGVEPVAAGVIVGAHEAVDIQPLVGPQRWATVVAATDPFDAERLAREEMMAGEPVE